MEKTRFKVGDKVKWILRDNSKSLLNYTWYKYGDICEILEVGTSSCYLKNPNLPEEKQNHSSSIEANEFELVEEKKKFIFIPPEFYKQLNEFQSYKWEDYKPKQTIMSKITTFAKNLVLSADEKLLRKYGLKNECGEYTDEAEVLVTQKLIKENEAYLIELAKGMEVEEKANK